MIYNDLTNKGVIEMRFIRYINYKNDDGTIETVEDLGLLVKGNYDRQYRRDLLAEYQAVDSRYYASQRASKAYYESIKNKETAK